MHGGGGPGDPVQGGEHQQHTTRARATPSNALSLDHVFEAISHPRRRHLLYLLRSKPDATLRTLADELVDWEDDCYDAPVDNGSQRVYISLYHTHLPKLEKGGIVDFDPETGTIEPGPNADCAFAALSGATRHLDDASEVDARESLEKTTGP